MKESKIKIIWSNKNETIALKGDSWFSAAKKAGFEINIDPSEVPEEIKTKEESKYD